MIGHQAIGKHFGSAIAAGIGVDRHVRKQALEPNFLMVLGANKVRSDLPRDGDNGGVIELGIVEVVQEMYSPGSGGAHTGGQSPRQLGLRRSGEGTGLFVAHADEGSFILPAYRVHHIVDGITGNAEEVTYAVSGQDLQQNIGNIHGCGSDLFTQNEGNGLILIQPPNQRMDRSGRDWDVLVTIPLFSAVPLLPVSRVSGPDRTNRKSVDSP
jgi:hypothetical protein